MDISDLYVGCITTCKIEHNRICISIYSRNNTARILSAEAITDNVLVIKPQQYPKDICKDESADIVFYYKDIAEPKQDLVKIEVQYSDTNGHLYKCTIVYDWQKAYIE